MGNVARKRATYQDVLDAPPNVVAEVLFGVLYTNPRPGPAHARTVSVLGMDLGGPFDRGRGGPGGWVLLYEPELHLGEDIVVPDLAGWRKERFERPDTAYFTVAPDFVCEVLSRRTEKIDRSDKMTVYALAGVNHAWLVDPVVRTLEIYRRQGNDWLRVAVFRDEANVRAEPFDAVEIELAALWLADRTADEGSP